MKKLFKSFIIGAAALLCLSYGQESFAVEITGGIRGAFTMNLGTKLTDEEGDPDYKTVVGGGAALYVNFGIAQLGSGMFGIQPEVGLYFNNGVEVESKTFGVKGTTTANSVDIPVLFTYSMPISSIKLGLGFGPYISIPYGIEDEIEVIGVGKTKQKYDSISAPFGLAFDVNCGFNVGPGALVVDVRYLLDLGKTRGEYTELGTTYKDSLYKRGALAIGLGYEMKF